MNEVDEAYRNFIESVRPYVPPDELAQVERAYQRARIAHGEARRKSGEPYITHPLAVASLLAAMRMDAVTLAAALLHDVLEDTPVKSDELAEEFGADVARLVTGVSKLDMDKVRQLPGVKLTYQQIEDASLVSLFMAMVSDLRVIVIKLCDRLHNMRTIDALERDRRLQMAHETLELFAPIATRLGIWTLKQELEDLSLRVIDLDVYAEIEEMSRARAQLLKPDLDEALAQLQARLADDGLGAEIAPLPEHVYGLYRDIQERGWESARTYDGLRVHIIVDSVSDCYAALGSVHSLWQPVPGRVVDYIAAPKEGLYRSLHICVIDRHGHPLEVRIRTRQMYHLARYGVVAYLQCPVDDAFPRQPLPQVMWLEELDQLPRDNPQDFLESLKARVTPQRIRLFTPEGDVRDLPVGATPVDFAYAVHTEIGHSCYRALVNNRFVPLNTPLHDGDRVEIIRADAARPDRAWLDTDLGYVGDPDTTLRYIRRWFARQPEAVLVEQGRELIEKEIRCWAACGGWGGAEIRRLARKRGMSVDELCLRVGRGEISASELAAFVLSEVTGWTEGRPERIALKVSAIDRMGLLRDACQVVVEDHVNMPGASAWADAQGLAHLYLTLAVTALRQVVRIAHRLERVPGVMEVRRVETGQVSKTWPA